MQVPDDRRFNAAGESTDHRIFHEKRQRRRIVAEEQDPLARLQPEERFTEQLQQSLTLGLPERAFFPERFRLQHGKGDRRRCDPDELVGSEVAFPESRNTQDAFRNRVAVEPQPALPPGHAHLAEFVVAHRRQQSIREGLP